MNVLGISAFYHDSAAAIVRDGEIVAAAQEERFTRVKHDASLPINAIASCLRIAEVAENEIDAVAFYEKPISKFVRILHTQAQTSPSGFGRLRESLPSWLRQKLWIPYEIERGLRQLGYQMPSDFYFSEHHESHAASAFLPSPFHSAAILTVDAVGEWATASIGLGQGNQVELKREMHFPHSLGLLYSAFTYFCGFRVNSGEYKLMGLAPFGKPRFVDEITTEVVNIHDDGSLSLNLDYFDFLTGSTMTNGRFADLFGGPAREAESKITKREADLAASIQRVTEEVMLRMSQKAWSITGESDVCLAGGVALNSVANGRLLREGPFERIWIQPAAGDAGGAIGCALHTYSKLTGSTREPNSSDGMKGSYLGPRFSNDEIERYLTTGNLPYSVLSENDRSEIIAAELASGKVVGLFQGRMEFGPRALGNRSILADPRDTEMQTKLNLKIKYRESFRPFAPAVLAERGSDYFDIDVGSPYMMFVAPVRDEVRVQGASESTSVRDRIQETRSTIPAVTHVDYSARVQTVHPDVNPAFHSILKAFDERTGCAVLVNTSFNVRGEPIVCTPEDAYDCFMKTEMDVLVLENCLLLKSEQPACDATPQGKDVQWLD